MQLNIRAVAEAEGLTMADLQRLTVIPQSTIFRYWHSIGRDGEPIQSINLSLLERLCDVLACDVGALLVREEKDGHPTD